MWQNVSECANQANTPFQGCNTDAIITSRRSKEPEILKPHLDQ